MMQKPKRKNPIPIPGKTAREINGKTGSPAPSPEPGTYNPGQKKAGTYST